MEILRKIERKIFNFRRKLAFNKKRMFTESDFSKLKSINDQNFAHNKNLNDLTFNADTPKKSIAECLKENGIVVISNIVPKDVALKAGKEVEELIISLEEKLNNVDFLESKGVYAQIGLAKLKNYKEFVEFGKPLLIKRREDKNSVDGGMLDFFNVDSLMNDEKYPALKKCYYLLKEFGLRELISSQSNDSISQRQTNIYFNKSVTNTRALHIDSIYETYKSFLYLTNVRCLEDGPYRFVPESHNKNKAKKYSILKNSKIANIYNEQDVLLSPELSIPFLGDAGSLIITYQNGIHGGTPQTKDYKRIILVGNYR